MGVSVCVHVSVCVCLTENKRDGPHFFKLGTTSLNSEFSFSKIGCLTTVKDFFLPYYLQGKEE